MSRVLKPNNDALCALRFIKEFELTVEQIMYRYTVAHINEMCGEIGLAPIEGETEEPKAIRLHAAVLQPKG